MSSQYLKVVSAFAIDGEICRRGEIVEVSDHEAKDLLGRGKAVLATEDDLQGIEQQSADAAKAGDTEAEQQSTEKKAKGK